MSNNSIKIETITAGSSNVYLIKTDNASALIDAGVKGKKKKILHALEKNGVQPGDVRLLIVTHTHYDHCGNLGVLKEDTGAKVVVHSSEAANLREGYAPLPDGTQVFSKFMVFLGRMLLKNMGRYKAAEPDILVDEKYDLNPWGIPGYILPTPGHTEGSISIILDSGEAFIGDIAFNIPGTGIYPPFANYPEELIESWEKLAQAGSTTFYPGHGKHISLEQLKKNLKKRKSGSSA
jgi:glyoxylase-like metal-dependent hydrolase (beta-lactamase superfamily II)